jgi:ABC-type bacteriocin/lantibiotic exporter with double-glycine peptidase domain
MLKHNMRAIINILDTPTMLSIIMISALLSLLTLTIPIAAQTLVNFIAFGKLVRPVITLSIIVLILMIAYGILNIWQSIIIEVMQQKIMVNTSFELEHQFTNLALENFSSQHGQEMVNRYFEIVTIQKSVSTILIYGINMSLQVFFGLILLLIYHPIFLVFDLLIILSIMLIVYLPYNLGVSSALEECTEKHRVGSWLEEILNNRLLFRFKNFQDYVTRRADKSLINYLKARNIHFRQLIKHQVGFYILSAFASSLLLGIGGLLVIRNQLSLGQLVAAEIVLGVMIYSFRRFSGLLEDYYDLLASEKKINEILKLPIESTKLEMGDLIVPIKELKIFFKEQYLGSCDKQNPLLLIEENISYAKNLIDFIFCFKKNSDFALNINGIRCNQDQRLFIRKHSLLLRNNEWFVGTIIDNLRLNTNVSLLKIKEMLEKFGLMEKIINCKDNLHTVIYDWENDFENIELIKLSAIRAIISDPQLLFIEKILDNLPKNEIQFLIDMINSLTRSIIIIATASPNKFTIPNKVALT